MRDDVMKRFSSLVEFLGRTLGPDWEVTLYDLEPEPPELAAIANGRVSGQTAGGSLPEAAGRLLDGSGEGDSVVNFTSRLAGGGTVRSSALLLRDEEGRAVGMLGLSFDDSRYIDMCGELMGLIHPDAYVLSRGSAPSLPVPRARETIHNDVPSLLRDIFSETLSAWPVPPDRLTQEERLEAISMLYQRGMFRLKGAVQYAAEALGCSQASVYRYLSRVRQDNGGE